LRNRGIAFFALRNPHFVNNAKLRDRSAGPLRVDRQIRQILGRFSTCADWREAADAIDFAVEFPRSRKSANTLERNEPPDRARPNQTSLSSVLPFLARRYRMKQMVLW
jgi:hypothetical protein